MQKYFCQQLKLYVKNNVVFEIFLQDSLIYTYVTYFLEDQKIIQWKCRGNNTFMFEDTYVSMFRNQKNQTW